MPLIEIKDYKIYLASKATRALAHMYLYDTSDNYFAHVAFLDEQWDLPDPGQWESGVYRLFYHHKNYVEVVDLLRNEKPVFLWWPDTDPPVASLVTTEEPIGEGELGEP